MLVKHKSSGVNCIMTSTFTILCPQGVVMAADSRISRQLDPNDPWKLDFKDDCEKICQIEGTNVAISYWGQATFQGRKMLEVLNDFTEQKVKENDDVNSVAEKIKMHFEGMKDIVKYRMGLHVAGHTKENPRLRHIFHEFWNATGQFVNEDCHIEYHLPYGDKVLYRQPKDYPALFNGDNLIANALFNYAPQFRPYYAIIPHQLILHDCVDLAKLIINTSIHRLNYYFDQRMQYNKVPKTVGGPIYIATVTQKEGFDLKKYDPESLKEC